MSSEQSDSSTTSCAVTEEAICYPEVMIRPGDIEVPHVAGRFVLWGRTASAALQRHVYDPGLVVCFLNQASNTT